MGGDGQFLEIIFLAMIAAFLVLRLRSVLGRKTGHHPRPGEDPLQRRAEETQDNVVELPDRNNRPDRDEADSEFETDPVDPDDPIAAGLTQVQIADNTFDPAEFLSGARQAFEMVVHAFATGDTGTLRSLLDDDVFESFDTAIKERIAAGETLETTVIGVKSADFIEAELQGRDAVLTVKFVSEQVNVTRDEEGHVVDGDPNEVQDVTDIWTFARNTRSRDPNWKLVETRSPN